MIGMIALNKLTVHYYIKDKAATNFTLLQWLVVDGIEQCSLKTILGRTRQTSFDSPLLQAMLNRYNARIKQQIT